MADVSIVVEREGEHLKLSGPGVQDEQLDHGTWNALRFDKGRILVTSQKSGSNPKVAEGIARCSIDVFHDMLLGLTHRRWTGAVSVDTNFGQKKLFFNHGSLVFASSGLIDDRLGEVIYREAMITLDQLTQSAVQVDRSTKFGQVLLRDRIFSNGDLWNALKNQVYEIFRSIFILPELYVEISNNAPPTEVTFDEGTENLIQSAYSAGKQFRAFFARLRADSKVKVNEGPRVNQLASGTFWADMIELVRRSHLLSDLLETSKLTDRNTLWVLHRMVGLGFIEFQGLAEPSFSGVEAAFAPLRGKIDAFTMLQDMSLKAFQSAQIVYPVSELQRFAWNLNDSHVAALYVDDTGLLGKDVVGHIMSQCIGNLGRISYFELRFDTLIRFSLQLVGDLLPYDVAKGVKKQFQEIMS
jgi:hypothetical protein